MDEAWLAWINTFGLPCTSLSALSDGVLITKVLHEIDPEEFSDDSKDSDLDNWVLRFNNYKKLQTTLFKYLKSRFRDEALSSIVVDAKIIARAKTSEEFHKLLQQVLLASLVSPNAESHRERLLSLDRCHMETLANSLHGTLSLQALLKASLGHSAEASVSTNEPIRHHVTPVKRNIIRAVSSPLFSRLRISDCFSAEESSDVGTPTRSSLLEHNLEEAHDYAQLQKQYRELESQFLFTDSHLAEKVVECNNHLATISRLEQQWVSERRSSRQIESDTAQYDQASFIAQIKVLTESNDSYKTKLERVAGDNSIYEERLSQLEGEILSLKAQITDHKMVEVQNESLQQDLHDTQKALSLAESELQALRQQSGLNAADVLSCQKVSEDLDQTVQSDETPKEDTSASYDHTRRSDDSLVSQATLEDTLAADLLEARDEICALRSQLESAMSKTEDAANAADVIAELRKQLQLQALEKRVAEDCSISSDQAPVVTDTITIKQEETLCVGVDNEVISTGPQEVSFTSSAKGGHEIDVEAKDVPNQSKVKRLLKKQDALIKYYKQKYELLQQHSASAAMRAEQALKEQKFNVFRKTAEERESRLKRENALLGHAFHDLAARLQQNVLALQRATAPPQSFLAGQRISLSMVPPRRCH